MFKRLMQVIVTRCGGSWVERYFLSNKEMIDYAIKNNLENRIMDCIKAQKLSPEQVTEILKNNEGNPVQEILLSNYELNEEQQLVLFERKNSLLIETYLAPHGYLEPKRTLSKKAEFVYVETMINKNSNVGIEMFKAYVDNKKREILTKELLEIAMAKIASSNEECVAAKYLLKKAYLSEEDEIYLVENASKELIEEYISVKQLYYESSQKLLIEKFYEIGKTHQEVYGFWPKAMQVFRAKRKEELMLLHPEGVVP
ncbi:MAG: hypothetical protein IKW39_01690 [Alphaproteobacteria bacterium]|nr:hypothetical protein [Alphaproteobacteria bacterium]